MIEHCFLDLDGVIVDFVNGALRALEIKSSANLLYRQHPGEWDMAKILGIEHKKFFEPMNEEFWANLGWLPDGLSIVKMLEKRYGQSNIYIWTSPTDNVGCAEGKRRWVTTHMEPHYRHNLIIGWPKHFGAASDTILVDDRDINIKKFAARNGNVCLVPRLWNSLHAVESQTLEYIEKAIYDKRSTLGSSRQDRQETTDAKAYSIQRLGSARESWLD